MLAQLAVVVAGPAQVAAAQTVSTDINPDVSDLDPSDPNGSAGGRVNGVANSADSNQIFYAATEWGGISKTIDGGLTWNRLDRHLPVVGWDVDVDDGNTGRVYATTFFDGRQAPLSGINVSQDGGATWTHPTVTPPMGCGADRADEPSAFGIGIRPTANGTNPRAVYIGTNCGVQRSTDGGLTWTGLNPNAPGAPGDIWDVVVQSSGTTEIVDVCGNGGHFRSINGGTTWTPGGIGEPPGGRCSIAVSPDENYVVLVLAGDNRLYESDDGGTNWTNHGFPDTRNGGRIPFVVSNDRNPTGATTFDIWAGGVKLYRTSCTTPAVPAPGGGARCPAANATVPSPPSTAPAPGWFGPFTKEAGAHDDVGDIEFDVTQPVAATGACPEMFSSDGGMYRNTDSGGDCHSPDWEQANKGLHDTWLWAMDGAHAAGDPNEDLYFGLQDSGSWATTQAGTAPPTAVPWSNKDCCDIFDIAAQPGRVLYTFCCAGGAGRRTTVVLRQSGMTGGGEINTYPPGGLVPGFNFADSIDSFGDKKYVMMTVDCVNPSADLVDNDNNGIVDDEPSNGCPAVTGGGSDGGVFVTNDITANPIVWTELGNASEPASTQLCAVQTSVPASDPDNPTFYAEIGGCGEGSSQLFKYTGTAPNGAWDRIDDNIGPAGIGIFAVDPNNPNRLYASDLDSDGAGPDSTRMVFSNDGGVTWQADTELDSMMTGNGTFEYDTSRGPTAFTGFGGYSQPSLVAFDPENANVIVAGGRDSGVFVSTDAGGTWSLLTDPFDSGGSGTPHLPRPWYAYFDHEPADEVNVYVGTQGRGVWRLGLPTADLSITKLDSPDPVNAGDFLTYTMFVTNDGADEANDVTVIDALPEQATYQIASPDVCTEAPTDTLTCDLGDISPGQTKQLDILVKIDPDTVSDAPVGEKSITNNATVTSGSIESDPSDNSASESTIVKDSADLEVNKTSDPDNTVRAGESFTWTIHVDNIGPSHARNVVLNDTILSGSTAYAMGAPTSDHGTCTVDEPNKRFHCDIGLLEVGDRAKVTVSVTSAEGGTFQDEAIATSDTPDPEEGDNRAVDFIDVTAIGGLSVTKIDTPDPVVAGEELTYDLTITNAGPSSAVNVIAKDFLPAQVSVVSVTSPNGSCNAGVPGDSSRPTTCTYGSIPPGSRTMTIVVKVHPDTLGLIHNDAEVTSETFDPDNSDNRATEDTNVTAEADLVIDKSDSPDPVQAGRRLTYELKVFNSGPSTAVAVSVEDRLPDQVDFEDVTISNGTGTCVLEDVDPAPPTKKLTCELGKLQPNPASPVLIHIDVIVKSDTPHAFVMVNEAEVSSSTADPDSSDNTSTEETTVLGVANLSILKTSDKDHYRPSETIKYTITVTNAGPSDAVNTIVTDNLPPVKQARYEFDTQNCSLSSLTLTCSLGVVKVGETKSFNIYFIVRGRKGQVTNKASVAADTVDPNTTNNSSTRVVLIKNI